MHKRFWILAGALVLFSMLSVGIGNARTVTITPRDTYAESTDITVLSPETDSADTASAGNDAAATYVLNVNTKKFHLPDCASVTQMKEKNRRDCSETRDELIAKGYTPCRNCNP